MQDLQIDKELAHDAAKGNEASWKRIFEATSDRLFALLCFQTGDRDEAKDLLQETYIQAFRHLGSYRGEAPLETWLRSIALRKALDWKRGWLQRWKRLLPFSEAAALVHETLRVEPKAFDPETDRERGRLHRALNRLSEFQRAALLLREWEERSFREIAAILGCNESTARVHHTRARQRMRQLLQGEPVRVGLRDEEGQQS